MSFTGQCYCHGVKAQIDGDPVGVAQCWCQQCQRQMAQYQTGGGPVNCAVFPADNVHLIGVLSTYQYTADSGAICTRSFCPECKNPIMGESSSVPQFRSIHLEFLERGHNLSPALALWTEQAPKGAVIDPAITQIARQ